MVRYIMFSFCYGFYLFNSITIVAFIFLPISSYHARYVLNCFLLYHGLVSKLFFWVIPTSPPILCVVRYPKLSRSCLHLISHPDWSVLKPLTLGYWIFWGAGIFRNKPTMRNSFSTVYLGILSKKITHSMLILENIPCMYCVAGG